MGFESVERVFECFERLGAKRCYLKVLANNDNSKQQIYFGGSFEVIRILPFSNLRPEPGAKRPTFKADLDFSWVDSTGQAAPAPGAQLILYPDYPEVRLSGFLRNSPGAPSDRLRPLNPAQRQQFMRSPRILFLGVTDDDRILAYVSSWGDDLAREAEHQIADEDVLPAASVFYEWCRGPAPGNNRDLLLNRLQRIYRTGLVTSFRLDNLGNRIAYNARNGAGYTLEGLLGITPNGTPGPDVLGWEIKAHQGRGRVTLMTPEPTRGEYAANYTNFMQLYGRATKASRRDFTGLHICGTPASKTGLTLRLEGFSRGNGEITDPAGGLHLCTTDGTLVAGWAFKDLIEHWKRKHANTAFVAYQRNEAGGQVRFRFGPMVTTAEGADLRRYLEGLATGAIVYDPGCNLTLQSNGKWKPKRRNQFRIAWRNLHAIYDRIRDVDLRF